MSKLIQRFLLISLIFWFSNSCKTLKVDGIPIENETEIFTIPYFNQTGFEYIYGAQITAFSNSLSGILVVKKIEENHKRIALLSDFGNTLLDIEFQKNKPKVNYVISDLNRRVIINKLTKYFQLLVQSDYSILQTYQTTKAKAFTSKFQGKRILIQEKNESNTLLLSQFGNTKEKVNIHFYGTSLADSIHFISREIPIEIRLIKR